MKVLLKADIKNVGKKGTVINASDGYARNYLFPRGIAIEATESVIKEYESQKANEAKKKEAEFKQAKELAKKMAGYSVTIKVNAGENGKLFGSITSKDIAEQLNKQYNLNIDKKKIVLDEAIKVAGTYTVEVKIYPEVSANVKVIIE